MAEPRFAATIREIDRLLNRYADWSIQEEMQKPGEFSRLDDTLIGYISAVGIEIALVELLRSRGIKPQAVVGHSGGEISAAYTAGIIQLEEAIDIIWQHRLIMEREESGAIAHIGLPPCRVQEILSDPGGRPGKREIFIAGFNSPRATVVSGKKQAVKRVVEQLAKEKVFCRIMNISAPFHSPLIESYRKDFFEGVRHITPRRASLPIYSCLYGGWNRPGQYGPDYWTEHFIRPVDFMGTIQIMIGDGYSTFVEISPHPVLCQSMKEIAESEGRQDIVIIDTLKRDEDETKRLSTVIDCLEADSYSEGPERLDLQEGALVELVEQLIRQVCERPDTRLDDKYLGFFDMGFDSLKAIQFKEQLSRRLGLFLPATTVFDYPDIASLTDYLNSRLQGKPAVVGDYGEARLNRQGREPVAVIGMGCRFPGGANNLQAFWNLLESGRDTVTEIPADRWAGESFYAEEIKQGKSVSKRGNFISGVDLSTFDAGFFNISPKEAESLDPQQRLLLEVMVEAMESASVPLTKLRNREVGVYIGICQDDFKHAFLFSPDLQNIDPYSGSGSMLSPAAGRISYFLGLRGPAISTDTACSSSLVALHLAAQALGGGQCEMAISGGVNCLLSPHMFVYLSQLNTLSRDGTCKSFADQADGFGRGEGCGLLVLKRLSAARRDNDNILALISGSAVNHDGASTGFTVPSGIAQQLVMRKALQEAGFSPENIDYVETHGAGTPLGDPIEIQAIQEVYGKSRSGRTPLLVGSVKTNIGHLEGAAGIAGVIKTILALQHQALPPHLHFSRPSRFIDWDKLAVKINTALTPWKRKSIPRRAGVSSFGFSGTNAHLVIEEAPEIAYRGPEREFSAHILNVSARTIGALEELVRSYREYFGRISPADLSHICYTAAVGRSHFKFRFSAVGKGVEDLDRKMEAFLKDPGNSHCSNLHPGKMDPRVVFLFSGQGSQYLGMARELYYNQLVFRRELDRCDRLFRPWLQTSLVDVLYSDSASEENLNQALVAQPVIFSVGYALSQWWQSMGVKPALVMGHSIGEVAAACVAGVFALPGAIKLVGTRARLMQSLPGNGMMVGILASEETVEPFIAPYEDVSIAAVNGAENVTISGGKKSIEKILVQVKKARIFVEPLNISHPFHSPLMTPYVEEFKRQIADVPLAKPQIPIIPVRGGAPKEVTDPDYWAGHLSEPVRFYDGLKRIDRQGYQLFLEIGGTGTLAGLAGECIAAEKNALLLASLRKGRDSLEQALTSLSQLYIGGIDIDWDRFYVPGGKKVWLPTYPFQRQRYWRGGSKPCSVHSPAAGTLPGERTRSANTLDILKVMIQSVSGLSPESLETEADLFSLGLDSLMLVELRRKIIGKYGIDITLNRFFLELTTLNKIASHIESILSRADRVEKVSQEAVVEAASPRPLNFSTSADLSQRGLSRSQARHLDALVKRYTKRTAASKARCQAYRPVLADSKAAVGFNLSTKEMLYPIVGQRAGGSRIWDIDGNEYIDLTMGFGVYLFGHHPPFLTEALRQRPLADTELGPRSYLVGEVAEGIARLTGVERVAFTNTGTEAVMTAIRLARAATGRSGIALFSRSYHGHSDGTLAVSYNRQGRLYSEPVSPGIPREVVQNLLVLEYMSPRSLEILREQADRLAAVLVEPVQSRYPDVQPGEFLKELRQITGHFGIALIFDEMITGFRLHSGGAQAYFGVKADICTFGKIIGGGLPIGVVAGRAKYLDHIDGGSWDYGDVSYPAVERTFFGGTFCQYHEAMAAAGAVLHYLEEQGPALQQDLNQRTDRFGSALDRYFEESEMAIRLARFGSIFRLDIPGGLDLLFYHLLEKGIYIWEWRSCFLSTAHSDEDLELVIEAVKESVRELERGGFSFRKEGGYYPMSSVQRRLYALSQTEEGNRAYQVVFALRVEGRLEADRVESTLKNLIRRHEVLRTGLEMVDDQLMQRVYAASQVTFSLVFRRGPAGEVAALIRQLLLPFDLARPPLMRAAIFEMAADRFIFVTTFHHSIMDGNSLELFWQDFSRLYRGEQLPPLKMQYKEYVRWEQHYLNSADFRSHQEFWNRQLEGELPELQLPTDFPRPETQDFTGDTYRFKIRSPKMGQLKKMARQRGASVNMFLLAVLNVLLFKLTAQEEIYVAVPVQVRGEGDFQNTIGMFANTLVMGNRPPGTIPFGRFLKTVKSNSLQIYSHHEYPYEKLLARNPSLEVAFSYENWSDLAFTLPGLTLTFYEVTPGTTPFDLFFEAIERQGNLDVAIHYRTTLFKGETIGRWARYFGRLIDEVLKAPETPLSLLEVLAQQEKRQILIEFNNTAADYPKDSTIPQLFEMQAHRVPDRIALIGSGQVSYRTLDRRADNLAAGLQAQGVRPDTIVAVKMERSPEMIEGILAILKAGGAYLPIDPAYPGERIDYMLRDSAAGIVLTDNLLSQLSRLTAPKHPTQPLQRNAGNLAYVIYTSGTTGKPKGTLTTHVNVIRVVRNTNYIELTENDRILQLSNYAFDGSVFDIYGALLNGAALVLIKPGDVLAADRLTEAIEGQAISVFFVTTALFNTLVDIQIDCFRRIRKVLFGGERVCREHAVKAFKYLGKNRIIHVYGPTETTVYATYYPIDRIGADLRTIPIGKPIANTSVYILDKYMRPVPPGVYGEVYIGGDGNARGYLNKPELTADKFVNVAAKMREGTRSPQNTKSYPLNPKSYILYRTGDLARFIEDGNIEFSGRVDQQVKIRGYRVEPEEIESLMLRCPVIKETVVLAREEISGERYLCAYMVGSRNLDLLAYREELHRYLSQFLPDYMVPTHFVQLDRLPLTPNGKIDRRALPSPDMNIEADDVAPRNRVEAQLVTMWSEILRLDGKHIGIDSNFFRLGGHSLKALKLISMIHRELKVAIPMARIFEAPRIRDLARSVMAASRKIYSSIQPTEMREYYPVSSLQKRLFILNKIEGHSTPYNLVYALIMEGEAQPSVIEQVCRRLIRRHESLRTSFITIEDEPMQRIHQSVDFNLDQGAGDEADIDRLIEAFIVPFDLDKAPLFRAELIKFSDRRHLFLYDIHHIVADGTSIGIFRRDFIGLWEGKELPDLKIQYKDFSRWQNSRQGSEALEQKAQYWWERLKNDLPQLDIYTDYPRPAVQSFAGSRFSFTFVGDLTEKIRQFCNETRTTLYMFLLACFTILLSKYCGQEDIIVGTPTAGREHEDCEHVIGLFINALPMRNYPAKDKMFAEFLAEIRANTIEAYENQEYPFGHLLERMGGFHDFSRSPIFEVELLLQNMEMPEWKLAGLEIVPYEFTEKFTQVDIALEVWEKRGEILFYLGYCTDLFKKSTMERFAASFRQVAAAVVEDRDMKLGDIQISHQLISVAADISREANGSFDF